MDKVRTLTPDAGSATEIQELFLILRQNVKAVQQIPCRCSSNRVAITTTKRDMYVRQYPTTIVLPNGATIQARYKEPRQIIKLPIDISTLTEEELEALKRKRKPKEVFVEEKEIEDSFDKNKYSKYWKR